jgi:hypothetical protein
MARPQAAGLTADALPAATFEKILDTKIIRVLIYRKDLAAIIETSSLNPSDRSYRVMHGPNQKDGEVQSPATPEGGHAAVEGQCPLRSNGGGLECRF